MEGKRITRKGANLMPKSAAMGVHRDSHIISKPKPKIRIIHIFAPEIIKTDVANFRELVQRLTGKPSENKVTKPPAEIPATIYNNQNPDVNFSNFRGGFRSLEEIRSSVKKEQVEEETTEEEEPEEEDDDDEEEEAETGRIWNTGENSGGYFGGFSDFEGFIKELGEFPLLPLDVNSHQLMHGFEEITTQFL